MAFPSNSIEFQTASPRATDLVVMGENSAFKPARAAGDWLKHRNVHTAKNRRQTVDTDNRFRTTSMS